MSRDENNLLESVVRITGERNKRTLETIIVDVLSDIIDCDALILLRVTDDGGGKYLEIAESIPMDAYRGRLTLIPQEYRYQRASLDDSISLCIQGLRIVSVTENDTSRILFPVVVNDMVAGVLDIYGHNLTADTKRLIGNILRIYCNFLGVIYDNEHDTLTGLLNRETLDSQLYEILVEADKNLSLPMKGDRRSENKDTHHWVGILDVDYFKSINDNYGHVYGDEVLLLFANLMRKSFRNSDLLFRYGGEEFVVVLAPTTEADALIVFERFRKNVETVDFPQIGRITVSIGMVKVDMHEHTALVLEHADQSLYYAKEHGRNQICNYHQLIKEGLLKERKVDGDIELF